MQVPLDPRSMWRQRLRWAKGGHLYVLAPDAVIWVKSAHMTLYQYASEPDLLARLDTALMFSFVENHDGSLNPAHMQEVSVRVPSVRTFRCYLGRADVVHTALPMPRAGSLPVWHGSAALLDPSCESDIYDMHANTAHSLADTYSVSGTAFLSYSAWRIGTNYCPQDMLVAMRGHHNASRRFARPRVGTLLEIRDMLPTDSNTLPTTHLLLKKYSILQGQSGNRLLYFTYVKAVINTLMVATGMYSHLSFHPAQRVFERYNSNSDQE